MSELPAHDSSPDLAPSDGTAEKSPPASVPAAMIRLIRPKQWTKNLLLFAALVFAHKLLDLQAVLLATLGFVSFCAAASSVYVVNDILDLERDRLHPVKRHRPIASGVVSPALAAVLGLLLTVGSLTLSFAIGPAFGVATVTYLGMSHFYSLEGKNIAILDVMLIAAGFVIRAVAGALVIGVESSNWFILCTLFLAIFIALCKRKAEMLALSEGAEATRPVLRFYTLDALNAFIATSMAGVLIAYALYVLDTRFTSSMSFQVLTLTLPFVMFGVFRYYLLVETSHAGERAEEVLLVDRPIQACVLGFTVVAILAVYAGL